jgi:hypothetical protein
MKSSLPGSSDLPLRDFEPGVVASGQPSAMGERALSAVRLGWAVVPLRGMTRHPWVCGSGTFEVDQVERWWTRWPSAGVGLRLDRVRVVVLDIDGADGDESLDTLLRGCGVTSLPSTYEVTTSRGRHLYLRLTATQVKLFSQYGKDYCRPKLDVLFNGLVPACGSTHPSGVTYTGSTPIPAPGDLPALPEAVYAALAAVGRPKGIERPRPKSRRRSTSERQVQSTEPIPVPRGDPAPPIWAVRWMQDISDGRNQRSLKAISDMVEAGMTDEQITHHYLASPLGKKALEQRHPQAWVAAKIKAARAWEGRQRLDKMRYGGVVHLLGLPPVELRILDLFRIRSSPSGHIRKSLDWTAIDAAHSSSASPIKNLVSKGLLRVQEKAEGGEATLYRLTVPQEWREFLNPQGATPTTTPTHQSGLWVQFPSTLVGHDAFRPSAQSLSLAYPLLMLLGPVPTPLSTLAQVLGVSADQLNERARRLTAAGLAVVDVAGMRLTGQPVEPLLDAAAKASGSWGHRDEAIERYWAKTADYLAERRDRGVPGTQAWRTARSSRYRHMLSAEDEVVAIRFGGDVQRAIEALIDASLQLEVARAEQDLDWAPSSRTTWVT